MNISYISMCKLNKSTDGLLCTIYQYSVACKIQLFKVLLMIYFIFIFFNVSNMRPLMHFMSIFRFILVKLDQNVLRQHLSIDNL